MATIQNLIGNNLRFFRKARGFTQEHLAQRVQVSPSYIGYLERGEKTPSLDLLHRLAQALGIESAQLLQGTEAVDNPDLHRLMLLLADKEPRDIQFLHDVAMAYFKAIEDLKAMRDESQTPPQS